MVCSHTRNTRTITQCRRPGEVGADAPKGAPRTREDAQGEGHIRARPCAVCVVRTRHPSAGLKHAQTHYCNLHAVVLPKRGKTNRHGRCTIGTLCSCITAARQSRAGGLRVAHVQPPAQSNSPLPTASHYRPWYAATQAESQLQQPALCSSAFHTAHYPPHYPPHPKQVKEATSALHPTGTPKAWAPTMQLA